MIKYGVKFPDGSIHGQWIYDSKKDLKEFAPCALMGDCSNWKDVKKHGYSIVKLSILAVDKI